MNELVIISAPHRRPLAFSRLSLLTMEGISVWAALSRSTFARPKSTAEMYRTARRTPAPAGGRASPEAIDSGLDSSDWKIRTTTATAMVTTARRASIATTSRRRSIRSVITPAGKLNTSHGSLVATPTRAMCRGLRVTALASHG